MISQLQTLEYIQPDLLQNVDVTWVYMTATDGVHQASFTPAMQTRLYAFWDAYMQASIEPPQSPIRMDVVILPIL